MAISSAPPASYERAAYLVLGMHRSGTSAATQLLALCGADLPTNVMPGDEHNEKGYFEPWRIAILNDGRLRAGGGAWDDPFSFPYRSLEPEAEEAWIGRACEAFVGEFGDARHPLLKDPRVTVLLPMWREALTRVGVAARCIVPVRHPLAVAGSLTRRNGFAVQKSVLLWTIHMLAAEAYTRDLPRAFVGYDALLSDWRAQTARIEAAHGAPLPSRSPERDTQIDGFLTPELRHNRDAQGLAETPLVGGLAEKVWRWFEAAAAGAEPDASALDEAAAEVLRLKDLMGVFVSPVTRDLDATRAELLYERQARALEAEAAARQQAELRQLMERQAEAERRLDVLLTARNQG